MCADYDEIEIARWLPDRGMNVDEQAAIDSDGFGGHTPLRGRSVTPNFWMNHRGQVPDAPFTRRLLDHASKSKCARITAKTTPSRIRDRWDARVRKVTPITWSTSESSWTPRQCAG